MTAFVIDTPKSKIDTTVDTVIEVLLDGSSSMSTIRNQTLSGLKEYFESLPRSKENSRTLVNVTVFRGMFTRDSSLENLRDFVDVNEITEIASSEYNTRGNTPLLDAIADRIKVIDEAVKTSPTPPAVLFVILTDGEENASVRNTREDIKTLITEMTEKEKWTFVFLGADQDSFAEASSYGISAGNTINYAKGAVHDAFQTLGAVSASYTTSNSAVRSAEGKFSKYSTEKVFVDAGVDNSKLIDKK